MSAEPKPRSGEGRPTLARARQAEVANMLRTHGSVKVSELVERFRVSDMTVRRDLDALEQRGEAEKVHGGAVAPTHSAYEPGFEAKMHQALEEKEAIATAALQFVEKGASIALSAGTTTCAMARLLAHQPELDLTVVTNSANVWLAFHQVPGHEHRVVLTGGMQRTPSDALVGAIADSAIRSLFVDTLFLGVHGFDPTAGFTTPNMEEAETNRTMISRARRLIVVADSTKWRMVGLSSMAPLSAASVLVTDDQLPEEGMLELSHEVGRLVIADADGLDRNPLTA